MPLRLSGETRVYLNLVTGVSVYYEERRKYATSAFSALHDAQLTLDQNVNSSGSGGTCYGDSGGPAFWPNAEGQNILVGITSWGDAQCVSTGYYYRTDIAGSIDFIDAVVASTR